MNMDASNLYREESYTDQKVGTIRVMLPVTSSGEPDSSRKTIYVGQTQMMTPAGALPLSFELEADNIADAVAGFGAAAEKSLEETMKELQEYRRQQASQIVMPGSEGGPQIQMP
jgi:hypothetical protein